MWGYKTIDLGTCCKVILKMIKGGGCRVDREDGAKIEVKKKS